MGPSVFNLGDPNLRGQVIIHTDGTITFQTDTFSMTFQLATLTANRIITVPDSDLTLGAGGGGGTSLFVVEVRTSDPLSPEVGRIWLRSDL